MHEEWYRIIVEARMRDIQQEAAHQRLAAEVRGTARFRFSLRWLRLPGRIHQQSQTTRSLVRALMRGYK